MAVTVEAAISTLRLRSRWLSLGFKIPVPFVDYGVWDLQSQARRPTVESGIQNPRFNGRWLNLGFEIPNSTVNG